MRSMRFGFELERAIYHDADIFHSGGGGNKTHVNAGKTIQVELPNGKEVSLTGTQNGFLLDSVHYKVGYPLAMLNHGMFAKAVASLGPITL
ncbi:hypothetical protein A2875_03545 [Candidatus Gottesmanbacteria bacterium RIFCSPHIGHO2_01_FULL_46_14]|uniref:Uncharacterized protein n=1 Tax=Candidatus Gottesmanbacteria bacterium RIFCSPHIGHO2_01_FULL_46_14 TaxID=1798380 RepID=A0A1F5ZMU5_9BACT|nr:MAG: hypothetical protein A2875_03545 [Candidatus Gottesmanbacteria bacterium RIFCSPHIGHO2_01_FULL_46_14]